MLDDTEYDTKDLLADEETWLIILETAFRRDRGGSDTLAHLLFAIKEAIERGPNGVRRAVNTLLDGIRLVYLHTDEHKLALRLYTLYLTGRLRPQDEPRTLLEGAIERGIADMRRAHKKRSAAKSKRAQDRLRSGSRKDGRRVS